MIDGNPLIRDRKFYNLFIRPPKTTLENKESSKADLNQQKITGSGECTRLREKQLDSAWVPFLLSVVLTVNKQ